jgi:drug/metabolite transporter (DMT)-like permease
MASGILFALAAGLMWGLVFIGPLLLPDYPAALQSFGRYLAFGLIALPLAWMDRRTLAQFSRADWLEAASSAGGQHPVLPVPGQRHPAPVARCRR